MARDLKKLKEILKQHGVYEQFVLELEESGLTPTDLKNIPELVLEAPLVQLAKTGKAAKGAAKVGKEGWKLTKRVISKPFRKAGSMILSGTALVAAFKAIRTSKNACVKKCIASTPGTGPTSYVFGGKRKGCFKACEATQYEQMAKIMEKRKAEVAKEGGDTSAIDKQIQKYKDKAAKLRRESASRGVYTQPEAK